MTKAKTKACTRQRVYEQIESLDMFGSPVSLNLDGKTEVKSIAGIIASSLIIFMLIAYGASRFNVLISSSNPTITQTTLMEYFDSKKIVKFDEIGFKVAFAVEQYDDSRKGKDDPNFVAWTV